MIIAKFSPSIVFYSCFDQRLGRKTKKWHAPLSPAFQKAEAGRLQVQSQSGIERDPDFKDQGPAVVFAWHEQAMGLNPGQGRRLGKTTKHGNKSSTVFIL